MGRHLQQGEETEIRDILRRCLLTKLSEAKLKLQLHFVINMKLQIFSLNLARGLKNELKFMLRQRRVKILNNSERKKNALSSFFMTTKNIIHPFQTLSMY